MLPHYQQPSTAHTYNPPCLLSRITQIPTPIILISITTMLLSSKPYVKLSFHRQKPINSRPQDVSISKSGAPVTAAQVTDILTQISSASQRGEGAHCIELVSTIKALARENELNRKCIASNGAGRVLTAAFAAFAGKNSESEEILSAITVMLPLDQEAHWHIKSEDTLKSLVSIANSVSPSVQLNALMFIIDLVPSIPGIATTDGLLDVVVKIMKQTNSLKLTKASLVAVFHLVSSDMEATEKFAEMGMVSALLEMLMDAEKSICEKVIRILERMFNSEKGREAAYGNALTVPVLVKKMFRVSEAATELTVSALWKLCREGGRGRGCVVEALQVGAFQKVVLLLQVGCTEGTKGRASDLLKVLNSSRGQYECVETMDLKGTTDHCEGSLGN